MRLLFFAGLISASLFGFVPSSIAQDMPNKSSQLAQAEVAVRNFTVSGGGAFQLRVPVDWRQQIDQTSDTQANIILRPNVGEPFEIMVTPIKAPSAEALAPATVRRSVEESAQQFKGRTVESSLNILMLQGRTASGYYYIATDKKPPAAGEYRYILQGVMAVGDVLVPFTVLYNDATGAVRDFALNTLRSATYQSIH